MIVWNFVDNGDEILREFESKINRGLKAIGQRAEGYAKKACPVGTPESTGIKNYIGGTLRNSISNKVENKEAYIGTNVEYAPYVEYGHHGYAGKHFLRKAASNHVDEYANILSTSLRA